MPNVNERHEPDPCPARGEDLVRAGKAAALGELTRGLAHELNNPLFAILGLVDFLVADAEPGSRAHRRLSVVRDTAFEMRESLRALLDFAREPADGRGRIELGETVRQTLELVARTSVSKDVELEAHLPDDDVAVLGSRNQIRQALLHLMANAFAAMPGGGTLTVGLERRDGWATVTVSDTGAGVPAELRDRIFEPFFTTRAGGSGLGLAACRAIAQGHGGTLELGEAGGRTGEARASSNAAAQAQPRDAGASFALRLPADADAA